MPSVCPRAKLEPGQWNRAVDAHEDGWWFHRTEWLDYALAYTEGSTDESLAVLEKVAHDDTHVFVHVNGLAPWILNATRVPVCGGQTMPMPLNFTVPMITRQGTVFTLRPGQDLPDAEDLFDVEEHHTNVVDLLDGEEPDHWRRVRKSYHSLINKAKRAYDITVHSKCDGTALVGLMARELHKAAAGRETRSAKTWSLMAEWLSSGHGVLAVATLKTGEYVGFAYAIRYKHWAYWASGATLRKDLQHALQWELMCALRLDAKTRYYELGRDADEQDDEKAKGIAFFKSGWGGTRWPVYQLTTK